MNKGLEALKRIKPYADSSIDGELGIIEKELKALEIIKDEFQIDFNDDKQSITLQSIEEPYTHIRFSLTRKIKDKDKYDLLKEVML